MLVLVCFTLLLGGSLSNNLWMIDEGKTSFSVDKEDYIGYLKSYDRRTLVFLTREDFLVYTVEDFSEVKLVSTIPHGLENIHEEYRGGFVTSHFIGYLTDNTLYYFKLTEDKHAIAYRVFYPASYFGVSEFHPIYSINLWRNLILIKSSQHTIHYLDFSSPKTPKMIKLNLPWTIGQSAANRVRQLKSFGYGTEHAILYVNNTMDIYDIVKQVPTQRFKFDEIVISLNYDYVTNKFMVMFKSGQLVFIDCKSREIIGSLKLKFKDLEAVHTFRTGTHHMALQSSLRTYYLNMHDFKLSSVVENKNIQESFLISIELSNILITGKRREGIIEFSFYHLHTNSSDFCHASCNGKCIDPFKPCRKLGDVYISWLIALAALLVLRFCCLLIVTAIEKRAARQEALTEAERESLKSSMILRNPLGASIIIQEKRSSKYGKLTRQASNSNGSLTLSRKTSGKAVDGDF